jgi:hypothetical protein
MDLTPVELPAATPRPVDLGKPLLECMAPPTGPLPRQLHRQGHFVPVPQVESITGLTAMIDKWDTDDLDRRIGARVRTVGELFEVEARRCSR